MLRVLRWRRPTPSRSSIRATALPTADDDTPSCRPATVKFRASAALTKAFSDPRLSIREPSLRTTKSAMFGTMIHLSSPRESLSVDYARWHSPPDGIHRMDVMLDANRHTLSWRAN